MVNTAGEVTGVSGGISGLVDQTISGVAANPSFPGSSYSPDGSFMFNNLYHTIGHAVRSSTASSSSRAQNPGGYWNLWGNSPGNYSLWESSGSYNYPIEESGSLSVAAAPELSTWAMLALGFAGLRSLAAGAGALRGSRPPRLERRAICNAAGPPYRRGPCLVWRVTRERSNRKIKPVLNREVVSLDS